jgi:hypothetical protein
VLAQHSALLLWIRYLRADCRVVLYVSLQLRSRLRQLTVWNLERVGVPVLWAKLGVRDVLAVFKLESFVHVFDILLLLLMLLLLRQRLRLLWVELGHHIKSLAFRLIIAYIVVGLF